MLNVTSLGWSWEDGCLLSSDIAGLSYGWKDGHVVSLDIDILSCGWEDGRIVSLDVDILSCGWEDGCIVSLNVTVPSLIAFKGVEVSCLIGDITISSLVKKSGKNPSQIVRILLRKPDVFHWMLNPTRALTKYHICFIWQPITQLMWLSKELVWIRFCERFVVLLDEAVEQYSWQEVDYYTFSCAF